MSCNLGFGAWQIGGQHSVNGRVNGWNVGDAQKCIRLVHSAIDIGVTFFDTAQGYGEGRSEQLIGQAIQSNQARDEVTICTKIPIPADWTATSANYSHVENLIMKSCQNLQVDCLDILLLHNPKKEVLIPELKGVLDSLAKRGLIGSFGVSASTLDVLKFASETDFGRYFEWNYSVFERRFETDFAKILRQRKQCFIGRSPLFRGLITESFLRDGPANYFSDVRSQLPQDLLTWCHKQISKIAPIADSMDLSVSELAIAYAYSNDDLFCTIPGVSKTEHIKSIDKILNLNHTTMQAIKNIDLGDELCFPKFL